MSKQREIASSNVRFADGVRSVRFIRSQKAKMAVVRISTRGLPRLTLKTVVREDGPEVVVKAHYNGQQKTLHTGTNDYVRAYRKAAATFWPQ